MAKGAVVRLGYSFLKETLGLPDSVEIANATVDFAVNGRNEVILLLQGDGLHSEFDTPQGERFKKGRIQVTKVNPVTNIFVDE